MRLIWLDEIYPQAWAALPHATYDEWFHQSFGTADLWDIALRAAGHESTTLIANMEHDILGKALEMKPDILVSQNIGMWPPHLLRARGFECPIVGMCSYAADGVNLHGWDVLFSSFKWLVDALNANGQRAVYLPLAFGKPVLERLGEFPKERDIDVAFVGGLGSRIWNKGTNDLAVIAEKMPNQFRWWGYRNERLPEPLERTYQGAAWGLDYYRILARTKILVNRHGEIARGFANNMRCYECGGMSAMLLNDCHGELYYSPAYEDGEDAVECITGNLLGLEGYAGGWAKEAAALHEEVMQNHCYENRVPAFLEALNIP